MSIILVRRVPARRSPVRIIRIFRRPTGLDELIQRENLLQSQFASIAFLVLCYGFVRLVEWWAPGFFRHPNLTWTTSFETLYRFWPLALYTVGMAIISVRMVGVTSSRYDEKIFKLGLVTATLAGIWEELGFRWLYVCTAMIGLVISNWMFGTAFGTVFALISILMGLVILHAGKSVWGIFAGIIAVAWGLFLIWIIWVAGYNDPIYWFYGHVMVPFLSFVSWGELDPVLKNPHLPQLFVFGMIAANSRFKDGHKYMGAAGMANAWIFGFVMMYSAVVYGIGTAVVLHVLTDVEFDILYYGARKVRG